MLKKLLEKDRSPRLGAPPDHAQETGLQDQPGSLSLGPMGKVLGWDMTPSPPNICFHGARSEIAELTQQYEKLYCFSVCSGHKMEADKEAQKSFINMDVQNKSNLLPPYQYPWPGLLSDCQIVAVADLDSPGDQSDGSCYVCIESLEVGGVLRRPSRQEQEEQEGPRRQTRTKGLQDQLVTRIYDQKRINAHVIQYLFYRWIRSIKFRPSPMHGSGGGIASNGIINMSIARRHETGRPTDDLVYNVNGVSYYSHGQQVPTSQTNPATSNPFGFDHSGHGGTGISSSSSPSQAPSSSSSSSSPISVVGSLPGVFSGYRVHTSRGGSATLTGETQQAPGPELHIPHHFGGLRSSGRGAVPAADKLVLTQEVMEEIYSGLSQVRSIRELLDIVHVVYKYISQALTVKCSMGGAGIHGGGSIDIPFPKNAGIGLSEHREEGFESDNSTGGDSEASERQLQEQMVKCCWELLEMEESIDKGQGYYLYWTVEHERFIWIHNIRKLLSLVNSDYNNNLDYISYNSWIEWIPNLDLFDRSLYNRYKKTLLSGGGGRADGLAPDGPQERDLDFKFLARPVVSLDMRILSKMHEHCHVSIDQKLIQLLNIELGEPQIYRVVLFELLRQINFSDKPEFEESIINGEELRNKSMSLLGIKTLDVSKLIPKQDSNIWSKTKLSYSDSLDMIRFVSNGIKNLFTLMILRYCFSRDDQAKLLGRSELDVSVPFKIKQDNEEEEDDDDDKDLHYSGFDKDELGSSLSDSSGPGLIDLNNLYYGEEEFPFKAVEILLSNILPIYTTSLDVFTKIQLSSATGGKNLVKLRLQSLFWYVDMMKQFLSGRLLLLNKFNDISRFTIPMISGVFNSPTLSYEQEDFLRISSPFYFSNNYFGDLFWRTGSYVSGSSSKGCPNFRVFNSYYSKDGNEITRRKKGTEGSDESNYLMSAPLLLLQSSKLLGSWGSYYNIYSSPRYLIHVGPYDIPIPISSYLLLKPFYKISLVNSLWNDILKRLIDSKKRDSNGNSTANNGLTVHLNRNLAVTGGNPLRYSLLSQSTRQILQMLPEKLRITERPFLIVFRGEGSTDFGGPFQEFLSWISNEIMSKNNENIDKTGMDGDGWHLQGGRGLVSSHVSAEGQCCFGLFTPCANALHSIGHNQDTLPVCVRGLLALQTQGRRPAPAVRPASRSVGLSALEVQEGVPLQEEPVLRAWLRPGGPPLRIRPAARGRRGALPGLQEHCEQDPVAEMSPQQLRQLQDPHLHDREQAAALLREGSGEREGVHLGPVREGRGRGPRAAPEDREQIRPGGDLPRTRRRPWAFGFTLSLGFGFGLGFCLGLGLLPDVGAVHPGGAPAGRVHQQHKPHPDNHAAGGSAAQRDGGGPGDHAQAGPVGVAKGQGDEGDHWRDVRVLGEADGDLRHNQERDEHQPEPSNLEEVRRAPSVPQGPGGCGLHRLRDAELP
ncbi:ubiquitin ligase [Cryptosporidium canis]|uniref:Ubiquitin ligase n=1 Tax=Cryptosporidium canis TaxID=195482 RepID=A0ABQ8P315_9CRYT|nr:ubiquitin ligase [Cryptosporidium canis]